MNTMFIKSLVQVNFFTHHCHEYLVAYEILHFLKPFLNRRFRTPLDSLMARSKSRRRTLKNCQ